MRAGPRRHLLAIAAALACVGGGLSAAAAQAAPPAGAVSFKVAGMFPGYAPGVHDYVVRCHDQPVSVAAHATGGWKVAVAGGKFRSGDFRRNVALVAGREFVVTAAKGAETSSYNVRCLPDDFPDFTYTRDGPVSPRYIALDQGFNGPANKRYAMIFDDHGVPVWWYRAPAWDVRTLPSGNVLWFNFTTHEWELHGLGASLIRTYVADGYPTNVHDFQLSGGGNYMVGADVVEGPVDTSAYGGSSQAAVRNAHLQELSPGGDLLWEWHSDDHISLAETGHRWPWVINHAGFGGYDVVHWNSIEPDGNLVIASFRNVDGVYKIRKSTGDIVWKLGGTETPQSLDVLKDPRGAPLGAQHDARLLSDGTLTVFDNATNLGNPKPRAVRFRIDQTEGTATLLDSITDPSIKTSTCCGSAQRLANGQWLVDWGRNRPVAGYRPDGTRTFRLSLGADFSYRAEPVPTGALSPTKLRSAMSSIYGGPG